MAYSYYEWMKRVQNKKDYYSYPEKRNINNNPYVHFADGITFYPWLKKNVTKSKIKNSFVLSFLFENEFNKNYDKLKEFVFMPFENNKQNSISQKWHFYIAVCLFSEYAGKIGREDGVNNLKIETFKKPPNKELKELLK